MLYSPTEAQSGPSQASKINLFARIANLIKLTSLTIFANVPLSMFQVILNTPRLVLMQAINRDALCDFVPFVQFEKREKQPWRSVTFSNVSGFSRQLY